MSDTDLLAKLEEGFRAGLEQSLPRVRHIALALTRDPDKANDLVQATMLRALESEATFSPDTDMDYWLGKVVRTTYLSQLRKRKESEDPDDVFAGRMLAADNPEETTIAMDALSFLACLPEHQATILALSAQGYTLAEIAERIVVPEGTAKSRLNRARTNLLEMLEE